MNTQKKAVVANEKVVIWVVGGNRRQTMDIFERWQGVGIAVDRWWSGAGRRTWETIHNTTKDATHMVMMTRWMRHSADTQATATAKDLGLKIVRLTNVEASQVATQLGATVPAAKPKPRPKSGSIFKTWTVGAVLELFRLRTDSKSWNEIADIMDRRVDLVRSQHSNLSRRYGGSATAHALLETYSASGDVDEGPVRDFGRWVAAQAAAQPSASPPPAVESPPEATSSEADKAEIEDALTMAVKHSERADKAEVALKMSKAEVSRLKATIATWEIQGAMLESTAATVVPGKLQADLKVALSLLEEARAVTPERVGKALAFGWRMGSSGATLAVAKALLSVDPDTLAAAMAFHNSEEAS